MKFTMIKFTFIVILGDMMIMICNFLIVYIKESIFLIDPCTNHSLIENEEKRSSAYTYNFDTDFAFSDDALEEGWYKVISKSGTEIPTEAPDTFKCGTWYPIWLDGNYNKLVWIENILHILGGWSKPQYLLNIFLIKTDSLIFDLFLQNHGHYTNVLITVFFEAFNWNPI